ncbi:MAG TPA: hypothetical protein VJO35_18575 [Terriglobales bacterium]|nr:hypothetical protein [Terriglobales bacterium]
MRALICWVLIAIIPSAVLAGTPQTTPDPQSTSTTQTAPAPAGTASQSPSQQTTAEQGAAAAPTGVLYGNGSVYLDGAQLSSSMPVMTGDVVETKDVSVAQIEMSGSTATVQPNGIVRFRSSGVALDRGDIAMGTGKSLSVFARDFEITPVSSDWTQFAVARSGGVIRISAIKNDVQIKCGREKPTIIKEGHELSRRDAENCGLADADNGAPPSASGPVLASPVAEGAGLAVAGGLLGWVLSHIGDDAVSPDSPEKP